MALGKAMAFDLLHHAFYPPDDSYKLCLIQIMLASPVNSYQIAWMG
jgi:hypothetical protein